MKLFSFELFVLYQGVEEGAESVVFVFRLFNDFVDKCLVTKTDGSAHPIFDYSGSEAGGKGVLLAGDVITQIKVI